MILVFICVLTLLVLIAKFLSRLGEKKKKETPREYSIVVWAICFLGLVGLTIYINYSSYSNQLKRFDEIKEIRNEGFAVRAERISYILSEEYISPEDSLSVRKEISLLKKENALASKLDTLYRKALEVNMSDWILLKPEVPKELRKDLKRYSSGHYPLDFFNP